MEKKRNKKRRFPPTKREVSPHLKGLSPEEYKRRKEIHRWDLKIKFHPDDTREILLKSELHKQSDDNPIYGLFRSTKVKTIYDRLDPLSKEPSSMTYNKEAFIAGLNNLYPFNEKVLDGKGYETDTPIYPNRVKKKVIDGLWSLFISRNFINAMMDHDYKKIVEEYDILPNSIRSELNVIHYTHKKDWFNIENRKSYMLQFLYLLPNSPTLEKVLGLLDIYLPKIKEDIKYEPLTFSVKYPYLQATWARIPSGDDEDNRVLLNNESGWLYDLEKDGKINDRFFISFMLGSIDEIIKEHKNGRTKTFDKAWYTDNQRNFFTLNDVVHIAEKFTARYSGPNSTQFFKQMMNRVMDLFKTFGYYIESKDDESKNNIDEMYRWIEERKLTYTNKVRKKTRYFVNKKDIDEFIQLFGDRQFIRARFREMKVWSYITQRQDNNDPKSKVVWEGKLKSYDSFYIPAPTNTRDVKTNGDSNIFSWILSSCIRMTENIIAGESSAVEHVTSRKTKRSENVVEDRKADRYGNSIHKVAAIMGVAPNSILNRRKNRKRAYHFQRISEKEYERLLFGNAQGEVDVYVRRFKVGDNVNSKGEIYPVYEYFRYMASESVGNNSTISKRFAPNYSNGSDKTVRRQNRSRKVHKITYHNDMRPNKVKKSKVNMSADADLINGGNLLNTPRRYFDREKLDLPVYYDAEVKSTVPTTIGSTQMKDQAAYLDSYTLIGKSHINTVKQLQFIRRVSNSLTLMEFHNTNLHNIFTTVLRYDIQSKISGQWRGSGINIDYADKVVKTIPDEQLIWQASPTAINKAVNLVINKIEQELSLLKTNNDMDDLSRRAEGLKYIHLILNLKYITDNHILPELQKLPKDIKEDIKLINNKRDFFGRQKLIKDIQERYPLHIRWKRTKVESYDPVTGEVSEWKSWKLSTMTNSERTYIKSRTFANIVQRSELINRLDYVDFLQEVKESNNSMTNLIKRICVYTYLNFDYVMSNFMNVNSLSSNNTKYKRSIVKEKSRKIAC